MKTVFLGLFLNCISSLLFAQIGTSNTIQSTDSMLVWAADDIVQYSYIPFRLTNLSGNNLNVIYRLAPIQPARFPSQWRVMIEHPHALGYTDSLSGDFKLNGDGSGRRNISVVIYPNLQSGHDTLRLVMYPDTDPTDTLEIFYIFTANNTLNTNIFSNPQPASIKIAPNPCKEYIHISTDISIDNEAEIYIYNTIGQIVLQQTIAADALKNGLQINLPHQCHSGIYQLQIKNKQGKTIANQSFIKI
jgi:hypothetical protein